jgi:hypothetical protein
MEKIKNIKNIRRHYFNRFFRFEDKLAARVDSLYSQGVIMMLELSKYFSKHNFLYISF